MEENTKGKTAKEERAMSQREKNISRQTYKEDKEEIYTEGESQTDRDET